MDLSIIIPCHNAAPYIGQAVASVLEQTGLPAGFELEIVIADDRSDDGATPAVLAELARRHPQVRVVANDGARGPGPARNCAARHARGRWLAFLDADDWWLPQSLARRWAVIASDPAAVWLAADFRMVFEPGTGRDGQVIEVALTDRPVFAGAPPIPGGRRLEEPVMAIAAGSVFVWTGTVMVRRDVFERLRGFDERLSNAEDTHLWLRLAREAPLNVVAGAVAVYRQRPGSVSNADEPPGYWDAVAFRDLYRRPEFRRWRRVLGAAIADRCLMDVRHYRQRGRRGRAFVANGLGLRYAPGSGQLWRAAAGTLLGRD